MRKVLDQQGIIVKHDENGSIIDARYGTMRTSWGKKEIARRRAKNKMAKKSRKKNR